MTSDMDASRCQCGKVSVPPRDRCPLCGRGMERTEVSNKGRLLSYTVVHVVPEGFDAPRSVALVQLGSGARVLCEMEGDHPLDSTVEVVRDGDVLRARF